MSIRSKLILLLIVSISGFGLVFAANWWGGKVSGRALRLERLAADCRLDMLQTRRSEKNFFLRREESFAQSVFEYLDLAKARLETMEDEAPDAAAPCAEALELLDAYGEAFSKEAELERAVGLDETRGMRKNFVEAGRHLEKLLKKDDDPNLVIGLLQLRRQEKNYIIRGTDTYLGKTRTSLENLKRLVEGSDLAGEELLQVKRAIAQFSEAFEAYVAAMQAKARINRELVESARALEPLVDELGNSFALQSREVAERIDLALALVEAVAGIVVLLIVLWTADSVARPLKAIGAYTRRVSEGELDAEPEGEFKAEFASLAADVTTMVDRLKKEMETVAGKEAEARDEAARAEEAMLEARRQEQAVHELWEKLVDTARRAEGFSDRVAVSSEQLAAMISQVKDGALVQHERMSETAHAMTQMSIAVVEVANNTESASTNASESKRRAEEGAEMVRRAIRAISVVNDHTDNMRLGMEDLERQIVSISQIMDVISEIADQTNLLALNAAIEAARAGDAGRGFAVVADEVRKLAEKTMTATKEVEQGISSIQESARKNIDNMHQAVTAVEESTSLAGESGRSQDEIVSIVEANTIQIAGIASASEQQSASAEEINRAVDEVRRIAEESVEGMVTSHQAVQDLTGLARELRQLVQSLLEEGGGEKQPVAL